MIVLFSISLLLFIAYAGLIFFYRKSWLSIPENEPMPSGMRHHTSITVIIPARNEASHIGACLTAISRQNYPAELYEVIVVDDHSTDDTATIVLSFAGKNIRLLSLKDFTDGSPLNSYKKKAIEVAIQQSSGTLVITTDADCIVPETWLATFAAYYEKHKPALIAAPVAYYKEKKFLHIFQSLDFMTLQGITGASVFTKFHSMCNGANLAYERKAFEEVNGFKGIDTIASGDDMLLMHKIFQRYPNGVQFLKSKQSIVQTEGMNTISSFLNQRIRWASKSDKYDDKRIFGVLLVVYFFNCCFPLLAIAALFNSVAIYWLIGLLVGKTVIELVFLSPVAAFFSKQSLLWWFPVAQPFHIIYTIAAGWLGKFGSYKWKERKVQ